MATYDAFIVEEGVIGERQLNVHDAFKLTLYPTELTGEKIIIAKNGIMNKPFFYDPDNIQTSGERKVMEYQGHFTWGEGNTPPRKHPLETSWTRIKV